MATYCGRIVAVGHKRRRRHSRDPGTIDRPAGTRRRRAPDRSIQPAHLQHALARTRRTFAPASPGKVRHVRLRHHGLRPTATSATRARSSSSTWWRAGCGPSGYEVTYVRNITDVDDKIIKRAAEHGETIGGAHRAHDRGDVPRTARARHRASPTASRAPPSYIAEMIEHDRARSSDKGLAYRAGNGDVYYRGARASPATASSPAQRSTSCAPASAWRCRGASDDPLDFALWKAAKPGEPVVGQRLGHGPPRLAHRVLGHGVRARSASTFDIHGGGTDLQFPAPRERDRAERGRAPASRFATLLDAQRLRQHRQREDVEVARQLLHRARGAAQARRREALRFFLAARALPQRAQLQRRAPGRRPQHARASTRRLRGAAGSRAGRLVAPASRRASATRWTTTSTRPSPSRCCTSSRRGEPRRVGRSSRACSRPWAARSASCRPIPRRSCRRAPRWTSGHRASDRRARRGQEGEELRRGRPHPQGAAGRGHRAQGRRQRHDMGSPVLTCSRHFSSLGLQPPSQRRPAPVADVPRRQQRARVLGPRPANTWSKRTGS